MNILFQIEDNESIDIESLEAILSSGLNSLEDSLSNFAQSAEFEQQMVQIYGNNLNSSLAASYQQLWTSSDFQIEPTIEIRSQDDLNGAIGAFSRDTHKIYLSWQYLTQNAHNNRAIATLIGEEYGH